MQTQQEDSCSPFRLSSRDSAEVFDCEDQCYLCRRNSEKATWIKGRSQKLKSPVMFPNESHSSYEFASKLSNARLFNSSKAKFDANKYRSLEEVAAKEEEGWASSSSSTSNGPPVSFRPYCRTYGYPNNKRAFLSVIKRSQSPQDTSKDASPPIIQRYSNPVSHDFTNDLSEYSSQSQKRICIESRSTLSDLGNVYSPPDGAQSPYFAPNRRRSNKDFEFNKYSQCLHCSPNNRRPIFISSISKPSSPEASMQHLFDPSKKLKKPSQSCCDSFVGQLKSKGIFATNQIGSVNLISKENKSLTSEENLSSSKLILNESAHHCSHNSLFRKASYSRSLRTRSTSAGSVADHDSLYCHTPSTHSINADQPSEMSGCALPASRQQRQVSHESPFIGESFNRLDSSCYVEPPCESHPFCCRSNAWNHQNTLEDSASLIEGPNEFKKINSLTSFFLSSFDRDLTAPHLRARLSPSFSSSSDSAYQDNSSFEETHSDLESRSSDFIGNCSGVETPTSSLASYPSDVDRSSSSDVFVDTLSCSYPFNPTREWSSNNFCRCETCVVRGNGFFKSSFFPPPHRQSQRPKKLAIFRRSNSQPQLGSRHSEGGSSFNPRLKINDGISSFLPQLCTPSTKTSPSDHSSNLEPLGSLIGKRPKRSESPLREKSVLNADNTRSDLYLRNDEEPLYNSLFPSHCSASVNMATAGVASSSQGDSANNNDMNNSPSTRNDGGSTNENGNTGDSTGGRGDSNRKSDGAGSRPSKNPGSGGDGDEDKGLTPSKDNASSLDYQSFSNEAVVIEFPVKHFWKVAKQQNDIESSEVGHCRGFFYRLLIHPKGTAGTDSEASHLSVFLEAVRQDWFPDDWVFPNVRFELTVVNFRDPKHSVTSWAHWSFSNEATSRGWQKMLSHSRLSRVSGFMNEEGTVLIRGKAEPPYANLWSRSSRYSPRSLWSLMPLPPGNTNAAPSGLFNTGSSSPCSSLGQPGLISFVGNSTAAGVSSGSTVWRESNSLLQMCDQLVPSVRTSLHADFVSCFILILYHIKEFRREIFLWNTSLNPNSLAHTPPINPNRDTVDSTRDSDPSVQPSHEVEGSQTVIDALQETFAEMQLWPLASATIKVAFDPPDPTPISAGSATDWLRYQLVSLSNAASSSSSKMFDQLHRRGLLRDRKSVFQFEPTTAGVTYTQTYQPAAKNVMKALCMYDVQKMDITDPLPHVHLDFFAMIHRECQIAYVSHVYKQALLDAKKQHSLHVHLSERMDDSCDAQELDHALRVMFSTTNIGSQREPMSAGDYSSCFLRAKHVHSMYRALEQSGKKLKRFPEVLFVYLSPQRNTKKGELFDVPLRLEMSNLLDSESSSNTAGNTFDHQPSSPGVKNSDSIGKDMKSDSTSKIEKSLSGQAKNSSNVSRREKEKQRKRLKKKQARARTRRSGSHVIDEASEPDDDNDDDISDNDVGPPAGIYRDSIRGATSVPTEVSTSVNPPAEPSHPALSSKPDKWYCLFAVIIREGEGSGGGSQASHTLLLRPEEDGPWFRIAQNHVELLTPKVEFSEWKCHRDFFCAAAVYMAEDYIDAIANGEVDLEGDLRDLNPELYDRTLLRLGLTEDELFRRLKISYEQSAFPSTITGHPLQNATLNGYGFLKWKQCDRSRSQSSSQAHPQSAVLHRNISKTTSQSNTKKLETKGTPIETSKLKFEPQNVSSKNSHRAGTEILQTATPSLSQAFPPSYYLCSSKGSSMEGASLLDRRGTSYLQGNSFSQLDGVSSASEAFSNLLRSNCDRVEYIHFVRFISQEKLAIQGAEINAWDWTVASPDNVTRASVFNRPAFSIFKAFDGTLSSFKGALILHHRVYQKRLTDCIRAPEISALKRVLLDMVTDRLALSYYDPSSMLCTNSIGKIVSEGQASGLDLFRSSSQDNISSLSDQHEPSQPKVNTISTIPEFPTQNISTNISEALPAIGAGRPSVCLSPLPREHISDYFFQNEALGINQRTQLTAAEIRASGMVDSLGSRPLCRLKRSQSESSISKKFSLRLTEIIEKKLQKTLESDISNLAELLFHVHKDVNTYCLLHRSQVRDSFQVSSDSKAYFQSVMALRAVNGETKDHFGKASAQQTPQGPLMDELLFEGIDLYVDSWLKQIWMAAAVLVHRTRETTYSGDLEGTNLFYEPEETGAMGKASQWVLDCSSLQPPFEVDPPQWLVQDDEYQCSGIYNQTGLPSCEFGQRFSTDSSALRFPRLSIPDIVCSAVASVVEGRSVAEWLFLSNNDSNPGLLNDSGLFSTGTGRPDLHLDPLKFPAMTHQSSPIDLPIGSSSAAGFTLGHRDGTPTAKKADLITGQHILKRIPAEIGLRPVALKGVSSEEWLTSAEVPPSSHINLQGKRRRSDSDRWDPLQRGSATVENRIQSEGIQQSFAFTQLKQPGQAMNRSIGPLRYLPEASQGDSREDDLTVDQDFAHSLDPENFVSASNAQELHKACLANFERAVSDGSSGLMSLMNVSGPAPADVSSLKSLKALDTVLGSVGLSGGLQQLVNSPRHVRVSLVLERDLLGLEGFASEQSPPVSRVITARRGMLVATLYGLIRLFLHTYGSNISRRYGASAGSSISPETRHAIQERRTNSGAVAASSSHLNTRDRSELMGNGDVGPAKIAKPKLITSWKGTPNDSIMLYGLIPDPDPSRKGRHRYAYMVPDDIIDTYCDFKRKVVDPEQPDAIVLVMSCPSEVSMTATVTTSKKGASSKGGSGRAPLATTSGSARFPRIEDSSFPLLIFKWFDHNSLDIVCMGAQVCDSRKRLEDYIVDWLLPLVRRLSYLTPLDATAGTRDDISNYIVVEECHIRACQNVRRFNAAIKKINKKTGDVIIIQLKKELSSPSSVIERLGAEVLKKLSQSTFMHATTSLVSSTGASLNDPLQSSPQDVTLGGQTSASQTGDITKEGNKDGRSDRDTRAIGVIQGSGVNSGKTLSDLDAYTAVFEAAAAVGVGTAPVWSSTRGDEEETNIKGGTSKLGKSQGKKKKKSFATKTVIPANTKSRIKAQVYEERRKQADRETLAREEEQASKQEEEVWSETRSEEIAAKDIPIDESTNPLSMAAKVSVPAEPEPEFASEKIRQPPAVKAKEEKTALATREKVLLAAENVGSAKTSVTPKTKVEKAKAAEPATVMNKDISSSVDKFAIKVPTIASETSEPLSSQTPKVSRRQEINLTNLSKSFSIKPVTTASVYSKEFLDRETKQRTKIPRMASEVIGSQSEELPVGPFVNRQIPVAAEAVLSTFPEEFADVMRSSLIFEFGSENGVAPSDAGLENLKVVLSSDYPVQRFVMDVIRAATAQLLPIPVESRITILPSSYAVTSLSPVYRKLGSQGWGEVRLGNVAIATAYHIDRLFNDYLRDDKQNQQEIVKEFRLALISLITQPVTSFNPAAYKVTSRHSEDSSQEAQVREENPCRHRSEDHSQDDLDVLQNEAALFGRTLSDKQLALLEIFAALFLTSDLIGTRRGLHSLSLTLLGEGSSVLSNVGTSRRTGGLALKSLQNSLAACDAATTEMILERCSALCSLCYLFFLLGSKQIVKLGDSQAGRRYFDLLMRRLSEWLRRLSVVAFTEYDWPASAGVQHWLLRYAHWALVLILKDIVSTRSAITAQILSRETEAALALASLPFPARTPCSKFVSAGAVVASARHGNVVKGVGAVPFRLSSKNIPGATKAGGLAVEGKRKASWAAMAQSFAVDGKVPFDLDASPCRGDEGSLEDDSEFDTLSHTLKSSVGGNKLGPKIQRGDASGSEKKQMDEVEVYDDRSDYEAVYAEASEDYDDDEVSIPPQPVVLQHRKVKDKPWPSTRTRLPEFQTPTTAVKHSASLISIAAAVAASPGKLLIASMSGSSSSGAGGNGTMFGGSNNIWTKGEKSEDTIAEKALSVYTRSEDRLLEMRMFLDPRTGRPRVSKDKPRVVHESKTWFVTYKPAFWHCSGPAHCIDRPLDLHKLKLGEIEKTLKNVCDTDLQYSGRMESFHLWLMKQFPSQETIRRWTELECGLCHRIDLETSGAVLIARTRRARDFLWDQFRRRNVHKEYLLLCHGRIKNRFGVVKTRLLTKDYDSRSRIKSHFTQVVEEGGEDSLTEYHLCRVYRRKKWSDIIKGLLDIPPSVGEYVLPCPSEAESEDDAVNSKKNMDPRGRLGNKKKGQRSRSESLSSPEVARPRKFSFPSHNRGKMWIDPSITGDVTADDEFSLCKCRIVTGRTHQIRVHMRHIGHPLVSDTKYLDTNKCQEDRQWCPRMFLHAAVLEFADPDRPNAFVEALCPLAHELIQALDHALVCVDDYEPLSMTQYGMPKSGNSLDISKLTVGSELQPKSFDKGSKTTDIQQTREGEVNSKPIPGDVRQYNEPEATNSAIYPSEGQSDTSIKNATLDKTNFQKNRTATE